MNHGRLTSFQKEQLLAFFANYMGQETRAALMRALPQAYNAWCGSEIVEVRYADETRTDKPTISADWHC